MQSCYSYSVQIISTCNPTIASPNWVGMNCITVNFIYLFLLQWKYMFLKHVSSTVNLYMFLLQWTYNMCFYYLISVNLSHSTWIRKIPCSVCYNVRQAYKIVTSSYQYLGFHELLLCIIIMCTLPYVSVVLSSIIYIGLWIWSGQTLWSASWDQVSVGIQSLDRGLITIPLPYAQGAVWWTLDEGLGKCFHVRRGREIYK